MDVKEIAEYLGFSPTKIYRMLTSGEIPNVKVGGQYRFPKAVIDDWLAGKLTVPGEVASSQSEYAPRNDGMTRSKATEPRNDGITRQKQERPEDEIIRLLKAYTETGDKRERSRASEVMKRNLDALEWRYMADRAAAAGVRDEAISLVEEIEKET